MPIPRLAFVLSCLIALACPNLSHAADIIFNEQFNDNQNHWVIADAKGYYTGIRNGKYLVRHKADTLDAFYAKATAMDTSGDFTVEGVFSKTGGADDSLFGLIFGYDTNTKSGYFFHLTGNGRCAIHVLKNGKWQRPLIGGSLPKIVHTGNQTNRLAVVFQGKETHFLLNGIFIRSVPRIHLSGNMAGVSAKDDVEFAVDRLTIYRGVPEEMGGAILSAKMYRDPGVSFQDMKILPYEVKAGALFDLVVDFTVIDSKRDGEKLPVTLSYAILEKDKELFKKTIQLNADANKGFSFTKKALIAATKKGKYKLLVTINYLGKTYGISQFFSII